MQYIQELPLIQKNTSNEADGDSLTWTSSCFQWDALQFKQASSKCLPYAHIGVGWEEDAMNTTEHVCRKTSMNFDAKQLAHTNCEADKMPCRNARVARVPGQGVD